MRISDWSSDVCSSDLNLDAMLAKLADAGLPVLLAGMLAPPNLGRDYGEAFNAIYPRLAEQHDVPLYPFFLEGVAAQRALNQADGLHRSDERRVGKVCVSTCRSRWSPSPSKKNT